VRSVGDVFNLIVMESKMITGVLRDSPTQPGGRPAPITEAAKMQEALKSSYGDLEKAISGLSADQPKAHVKLLGMDFDKQGAIHQRRPPIVSASDRLEETIARQGDVAPSTVGNFSEKENWALAKTALIVGVSGIVGGNLAECLFAQGDWAVYGLARRPREHATVTPIAVDLQDAVATKAALEDVKPTHVFITTWLRQSTESENIRVNAGMVRNVLDAVSEAKTVHHVALVTGLKHYLGPFESYGKGTRPATPFREEQPRLDIENFYYAQEDEVFAAAERDGYGWSIHRPHTIIGFAVGNAMNMGTTLAVYATICKALGKPMRFPGSSVQWNSLTDLTDARLLAQQLLWASTTAAARNQAFNIANGDVFRWSWMWNRVASWFDVEAEELEGEGIPLETQLAGAEPVWKQIAAKHCLVESNLNTLSTAWHTDIDLGRKIEVVTDMSKSRKLGFNGYQPTDESFYHLFERLRKERLIP
jgi:nucleoside-diphosphate-sugar epimerase